MLRKIVNNKNNICGYNKINKYWYIHNYNKNI